MVQRVVLGLISEYAAQHRLLIVFDDAQWLDVQSWDVLKLLCSQTASLADSRSSPAGSLGKQVRVFITYREVPNSFNAALREIGGLPQCIELYLDDLTRAGVARVLHAELGATTMDATVLDVSVSLGTALLHPLFSSAR